MFYPTPKELEILKALKKYHYMTVDQVMLATDEPYRGTAARLAHLGPREKKDPKEEKNTIRYAWRIGRPQGLLYISPWSLNLVVLSLQVHHINHDPMNPEAVLRVLCPSCHWKYHKGESRGAQVSMVSVS